MKIFNSLDTATFISSYKITDPHHRHNRTDIEESMEISLEEILKYIEKQLK